MSAESLLSKRSPLNFLRNRLMASIDVSPSLDRLTLETLGKNNIKDYLLHTAGTASIGTGSGLAAETLKRVVEGKDINFDDDMLTAGLIGAGIGTGASLATAPVKAIIASKLSIPIELRKSLFSFAENNPIRGGIILKAPPTKKAIDTVDDGVAMAANFIRRLDNLADDTALMMPLAAVPAAPWFKDNFQSPFKSKHDPHAHESDQG